MFVVTGASSKTGSAVAAALIESGAKVRLIGRNACRLARFAADAEIIESEPNDVERLRHAFIGAAGAFVMLQPGLIPDSTGFERYQANVVNALAQALAQAEVRRAVVLSGWGANYPLSGNPLLGLRYLEQELSKVPSLAAVVLRAGWFMENTEPFLDQIRNFGYAHGPVRGDLLLPMIATRDIGKKAAQILLTSELTGSSSLELQGPEDRSLSDIVIAAGKMLGKPGATYTQITSDEAEQHLLARGFSKEMAKGVVQISEDLNEGRIRMLTPRNTSNSTPTTFENYLAGKLAEQEKRQG